MREHTHAGIAFTDQPAAEISQRRRASALHQGGASSALGSPTFLYHFKFDRRPDFEILALTPAAIDIDSGVVNIATLKRRKRGMVRQVPFLGVLSLN